MAEGRYTVMVAGKARKALGELPAAIRHRVARAIDGLEHDPRPRSARQLAARGDQPIWRLRVGDYRILYEIREDTLVVLVIGIGHRGVIYRKHR